MTSLTQIAHLQLQYLGFKLGGTLDGQEAFNGQFASPVFGAGDQYAITSVAALDQAVSKVPTPSPYMPGLFTQKMITTTVNQPVDAVGVVQATVMPTPQDFFSEYSVSGWFKWIPPTTQGQWSLAFRFSNTDKNVVENLAYLGDRDLSVWLGKS